jgi:hypothetical protein
MLEPYTSGSIGAAKNGNSGLAGLEINLGASKGRRSRHRTLYSICNSTNFQALGLQYLKSVFPDVSFLGLLLLHRIKIKAHFLTRREMFLGYLLLGSELRL